MGFFQSIHTMYYAILICAIILSVRSVFSIVGWLMAFGAVGKVKRQFSARVEGEDKRSGALRWTLD